MVGFCVSPQEVEEVNVKVALSGLNKQDYIMKMSHGAGNSNSLWKKSCKENEYVSGSDIGEITILGGRGGAKVFCDTKCVSGKPISQ